MRYLIYFIVLLYNFTVFHSGWHFLGCSVVFGGEKTNPLGAPYQVKLNCLLILSSSSGMKKVHGKIQF